MDDFVELKENYWRTVARTRKSGRIAPGVKLRVEKGWERFDKDVVRDSLRIHIDRYPNYKENYTVGIMRNLQKQKESGAGPKKNRDVFAQMGQACSYDMDELEKNILAN